MRDNLWFRHYQPLLLPLLNTAEGRDLLCVDKVRAPVVAIRENVVTFDLGGRQYQSDFRTGAKWGNIIRTRWPWVRAALEWQNERLIVSRPLWVPAGAESLTVRPDPSPEATSVDGRTNHNQANQTWATIRDGAGTGASDTEANQSFILISCGAASGQWTGMFRGIFLFDTSALTAAAVISAATQSLWGTAKQNENSGSPDINIYSSAPASNTQVVAGDFDSLGTTPYADTAVTYAGWSTTGNNNFVYNATGLAAISKTGITKTGCRNANYDVANSAPTWNVANASDGVTGDWADQTGTNQDPKLVVNYSLPWREWLTSQPPGQEQQPLLIPTGVIGY